jgi:hypothetical protein
MTSPAQMSAELLAHRRRLYVMIAIVSVCFLVSGSMVLGYFATHQQWMLFAFVGAIATGFAAQGWMIVRFRQSGRPKA